MNAWAAASLTVLSTFLGGAIAAITAVYLEQRKETKRLSQLRNIIKDGILDDLSHSLTLYDRIQDEWEKSKVVWFSTITEFQESRQTYTQHRDYVLLLNNQELRKKLFRYYLKTNEQLNLAQYQQQRIYDIGRKYKELLRDIGLRSPELPPEESQSLAMHIMKDENAELIRLQSDMPQTVNRIFTFKAEAQEIINELVDLKC